MSLTGKTPKDTYKDLLELDNSNSGVDSTSRTIKTGDGSSTAISVSDRSCTVKSQTDNTTAFTVRDSEGTIKLLVDTTNDNIKGLGHIMNTQYAHFGISDEGLSGAAANTHYPIPFSTFDPDLATDLNFGTGTDPATSWTAADATATDAGNIVPMILYVPDNISIDAVYSIEGGDHASGDTTRMHLFSYDYTSGSSSVLTNGTLLALNSDVTNAGSEQTYLSTWTISSSSVTAGKAILAFWEQDGTNGDYSVSITVKYHLI